MDFYSLYIDLLITTGGIEPFRRNVDSSMVVFLHMLFLKYYHAQKHPILHAILNIGLGLR